ncbi:MAG: Glycosyltransferase involved in cell wall bisynthesis [uncultured Sulfurovum sp.]|uniref:Glycosyltransferase involved in cell wall bisynthesis n=1 Tax=uncultured Sulfurovum sp. TaxID=269237 RepID=A0A6S6U9G3_9BACT|nr:MAG: Glycosyltransferase involved in cell wall bisynthesis [uncultured Sulfurovum sp.]
MKIFLISNMYPSIDNPSYGVFVKNFEDRMNSDQNVQISHKVVIDRQGKNKVEKIWKYLKFYFSIIKVFIFGEFDIVYVHFPIYVTPVLIGLPSRGKKLVLNFHGSDVMGSGRKVNFLKYLTSILVQKSTLIVAPSSFLADELKVQLLVSEDKLFISPSGGVDKRCFYPIDREQARRKIGIENKFTVGFISRFDQGKGWDVFLDAVAILKNDYNISVQAVVVGDGTQKNDFFDKIDQLSIEENIKYFGRKKQNELAYYFNSLDVFVASSTLMESLGLIGLEAMSCSIPVVGSNKAGIATYISEGYNGYLFTPGDPVQLAEMLRKYFLLNEDERSRFSTQAKLTSKKYVSERVHQELIDKLESLDKVK